MDRLRSAGAVLFGKSNLPAFSSDFQTHNELFGLTRNPWNLSRTAGGSSGGAAAAVAAGLTGFELGTDLGGSLRIPASHCGVCSHKPSFGLVPQRGYINDVAGPMEGIPMNVLGPIARGAGDLETVLEALASVPQPASGRGEEGWPFKAGFCCEDPAAPVSSAVAGVLRSTLTAAPIAGLEVAETSLPIDLGPASATFLGLSLLAAARPSLAATEPPLPLPPLEQLTEAQGGLESAWDRWFERWDVLLCPVMAVAAFPHDYAAPPLERLVTVDGEQRPYAELLSWCGMASVAGLPATVVPLGLTAEGMPVAVQIVGPRGGDRTTLAVARLIERAVAPLPRGAMEIEREPRPRSPES